MSRDPGNGARRRRGSQPSTERSTPQSSDLENLVAKAVDEAIEIADEESRQEAENSDDDFADPLPLGPQRYTDPDIWAPNYSLLPSNSPERKAYEDGNPIPLTQDKRMQAATKLVNELNAESPYPGDPF
jgi:hypothetical protein